MSLKPDKASLSSEFENPPPIVCSNRGMLAGTPPLEMVYIGSAIHGAEVGILPVLQEDASESHKKGSAGIFAG